MVVVVAVAQVDVEAEITSAQLLARIPGYHALVVRSRTKVDNALLAAAGQLRVVGRAGVGVDNVDVEAAAAKVREAANTCTRNRHKILKRADFIWRVGQGRSL